MASLGATSDLLGLLAEPSRVRLLALLAGNELTVNELTNITELGQSRVSTHLGKLRTRNAKNAGWPESVAGEMERHYSPGRTWEALAGGVIGLLRLGDVLDA